MVGTPTSTLVAASPPHSDAGQRDRGSPAPGAVVLRTEKRKRKERKGLKGEQRGEDAGRGLQPSPATRRRRAGRRRSASSSRHERTETETGE
jgi:hypothetical protein